MVVTSVCRAVREYCYSGDVQQITSETAIDLLAASAEYSLQRFVLILLPRA